MLDLISKNAAFLGTGLAVTVELAAWTIVGGTLLGFALGIIRFLRVPVLSQLAVVFIEFIRGTPLLVVLFICYFALPALFHAQTTAYRAAMFGFIAFIAAYIAEDVRSGLRSVRGGLVHAGLALGLTRLQALRFIVVPLAIRRVLPPLFSQYVRLIKFTSVASVIGVNEFTGSALLVNARVFQPVTIILGVALTYFVLCYVVSLIGRTLYARLAV
ncbi:MAG TPA: amino acid ABC transporter permease [Pseudolabrys sp.]|nr:amino acid ABC transporter permease [Pseudolabrys sp.]